MGSFSLSFSRQFTPAPVCWKWKWRRFSPKAAPVSVSCSTPNPNRNPISSAETIERLKLKQLFHEAYLRCHSNPMDGVSFTLDDFHAALNNHFVSQLRIGIGTKVKGRVLSTDGSGAVVVLESSSSSLAYLPIEESSIFNITHVEEAGVYPGLIDHFLIIDQCEADQSFILSLRALQLAFAWERCRQLLSHDSVIKTKVVGANKVGFFLLVEGLTGFLPFSLISTKSTGEDLLNNHLYLKFVDVDEKLSRLVLSNHKAMFINQAQLRIGSVVTGTVESLKPYGAIINIGGVNALLHVSQISHSYISDIANVLQPGDTLKVMILSHDHERGRVSLSTKKLEPSPGDMIHNPKLVFEKADEMAQTFRQKIAQAEAMARADLLRFQPESGCNPSFDGISGPPTSELPP